MRRNNYTYAYLVTAYSFTELMALRGKLRKARGRIVKYIVVFEIDEPIRAKWVFQHFKVKRLDHLRKSARKNPNHVLTFLSTMQ